MSVVARLVLGLLAGFIASRIVNHGGMGVLLDMLFGIAGAGAGAGLGAGAGAFVGGFLFHAIGAVGVTGLNRWSLFVSVLGACRVPRAACLVLALFHAVAGRRFVR